MSDPTTPEGRTELRRLIGKAESPRPWVALGNSIGAEVDQCTCAGDLEPYGHEQYCGIAGPVVQGVDPADAELIAAAVNALPALLDALDDAECEIERQRGDLVIERRRANAAEAALGRVRELAEQVGASTVGCSMDACDGGCFKAECPDTFADQLGVALDGDQ